MKRMKAAMVVGACLALVLVCTQSQAKTILVVSDQAVGGRDDSLVAQLQGWGYTVDTSGMNQAYREGNNPFSDAAKVAALNNADLIVVSRHTSSGSYDNDRQDWNAVPTPMILMSGYLTRDAGDHRWGWTTGGSGDANKSETDMVVVSGQEGHPFLNGLTGPVTLFDWSPGSEAPKGVYLPNAGSERTGTTVVGTFDGRPMLMDIPAGFDFDEGGALDYGTAGDRRVLLSTWGYDSDPHYFGEFHTADYDKLFGNAVGDLTTVIPEPVTMLALAGGLVGLGGYVRRRRQAGA